uniref:Uncharacterized protein n=1 Tax=Rhizophora mucronata TaxID=61149 RepID=A0A2P2QS57_RHIMU
MEEHITFNPLNKKALESDAFDEIKIKIKALIAEI